MGALVVEVGVDRVEAVLVDDRGDPVARARHDVDTSAPDSVWRGLLTAAGAALADAAGRAVVPSALSVADPTTSLVVWDVETLGCARPALVGGQDDVTKRIARLAAHEPHTWALVLEGQYALGTYESYLVARLSRGTYHVTDAAHAARTGLLDPDTGGWAGARCARLGVPLDALPEIAAGPVLARTEPGCFLGLDLPVTPAR